MEAGSAGRGSAALGESFAIERKETCLFNSLPPFLCVRSIRSVMQKYLEEREELTFDKIFNQKIGKS